MNEYGVRHTSPLARSGGFSTAQPRHCSRCGRGLTQRTRVRLNPTNKLLLAVFGFGPLCNGQKCLRSVILSIRT